MIAYGFANAYGKPLSQRVGPAQMLFLRGITVSIVLALASISSYHYFTNWFAVCATVLLGVAGYLPVLAFTHGVKMNRVGIVTPIAGASPLVTVLLAFLFLAVPISTTQWLAIILVILANVAISFDFKNWRESSAFQLSSGIPFALIAAVGWGLFYFFLVPSTQALGPWLSAFLVEIGVTGAAGLHMLQSAKPLIFKDMFSRDVMVNGFLLVVGTVAFTFGVRYYNVGIVAALSNSTALVSVLIGALIFREHLRLKEKIAVAVMIVGIIIITLT